MKANYAQLSFYKILRIYGTDFFLERNKKNLRLLNDDALSRHIFLSIPNDCIARFDICVQFLSVSHNSVSHTQNLQLFVFDCGLKMSEEGNNVKKIWENVEHRELN